MYLGIDIGGTKTLVACLNGQGVIQEEFRLPTPKRYDQFLNDLAKTVAKLSTKEFHAAGVAVPGRLDRNKDIVDAFGNLPWRDVPIEADVKHMLDCPVVVKNDAKLAGLSEAMLLKDKYSRVLYVTISTGIGVGFIIDQRIDESLQYMEAGCMPVEHNGKLEEWQAFASGKAIVKRFGKKASEIDDEPTWEIIARNIAVGLVDLVAVIQPEVIVLGGSVGAYFNKYSKFLRQELKKYETPMVPMPRLQEASRPEQAVIYGCFDLAKSLYGKSNS